MVSVRKNTDKTEKKQKKLPSGLVPWKPGQSGNPIGRPKGARNQLSETFIKDVLDDWKQHGKDALMLCRATKPDVYVKVVASLIPREMNLKNGSTNEFDAIIDQFSPEQLSQFVGALAAFGAATDRRQKTIEAVAGE